MSDDSLEKRYKSLDDLIRLTPATEEAIRPDCLITFPYRYEGKDAVIVIDTEEFTAVCPWTGLPDSGILTITYVPQKSCLELKSLKYYLLTYRSVGMVQEDAANRLLKDLADACLPKSMTVRLDYKVRGGLHTVVTVHHP